MRQCRTTHLTGIRKKKNFKHQTILYELNLNDQFKSAKYTENILT